MRKLVVALVAVAAISSILYFVWSTRQDAAPPAVADNSASAAPTQDKVAKPIAKLESAAQPTEDRSTVDEVQAGADALDPAKARHLRGRVAIPSGTPNDEELEVFALSHDAGRAELCSIADPRDDHPITALVARTKADAQGAFELLLPEKLTEVHVFAFGRYASSRAALSVDLKNAALEPRIETELGTWLRGSIAIPSDGESDRDSLVGLELRLEGDDMSAFNRGMRGPDSPDARSTTSKDGKSFELRSLFGAQNSHLFARPEGKLPAPPKFAAAKSERFDLAPGSQRAVTITLTRGATLVGIVVDENGAPVEGAKLAVTFDARIMGLGGTTSREGLTRADGTFELAAVRAGKSKLGVKKRDYLDENFDVELAEGERREGQRYVLTHGASVAGTVLWPDKTPAAGANVSVGIDRSQLTGMNVMSAMRGADGKTTAGVDGTFVVRGLGTGPFVVRADSPPRGSSASDTDSKLFWRATKAGVAPNAKDIELVIAAPEGIAGRVVDEKNAPVQKFAITVREKTRSMIPGFGGEEQHEQFDDADGRFLFQGLQHGEFELVARAEGFGEPEPSTIIVPQPAGADPLSITLQHVATVSGTVLDWSGAPAKGASVAQSFGMGDLARMMRPDHREPKADVDEQGHYVLENLTPGKLDLVAKSETAAASEPVALELAPGETRTGVDLKLRQGGRLTGEVFAADGKPAIGARVMAQMPMSPTSQHFSETDAKGHFEIEHLEAGSWQAIYMPWMSRDAEAPSGNDMSKVIADMKMTMADIKDGEETHVVLGAPPANPVRIHGRIAAAGVPVTGVALNFVADGMKNMSGLKFVSTDAQGRYDAKLDAAGRYLATVQKIGSVGAQQSYELSIKVPEVEDFTFDVDLPLGAISGRVYDSDDKPASKTRVSLTPTGAVPTGMLLGGRYSEMTTDENGNFVLEWLKPGDYSVAAGGAMFGGLLGDTNPLGREMKLLTVHENERIDHYDFHLKASGTIKGLVKDKSGNPIASAGIFVRDSENRLVERLSLSQTDATGHFTYAGLAEGAYSVSARTANEASSASVATVVGVHAGKTAEVQLSLEGATTLIISTVDDKDVEVDADVLVTDEAGRQVNGIWTLPELMNVFTSGGFNSKEQRVGPLGAGKYKVVATTTDGRSASKSVTLSGQAERHLKLKL